MRFAELAAGALALALAAAPALAGDLSVSDAYARAASPVARAGAIFMTIRNAGATDARLTGAETDAAMRVELHTHLEDASGVMRMVEVEDGIVVPAGGAAQLRRGGDHVMLMGLTRPLQHGDTIDVTLSFEDGTTLFLTVPVDLERMPERRGEGQS